MSDGFPNVIISSEQEILWGSTGGISILMFWFEKSLKYHKSWNTGWASKNLTRYSCITPEKNWLGVCSTACPRGQVWNPFRWWVPILCDRLPVKLYVSNRRLTLFLHSVSCYGNSFLLLFLPRHTPKHEWSGPLASQHLTLGRSRCCISLSPGTHIMGKWWAQKSKYFYLLKCQFSR